MFETLILKLTHRLWNRQISRILCRAYSGRVINSSQMHVLAAAFDPTQRHAVYGEFRNREIVLDVDKIIGEARLIGGPNDGQWMCVPADTFKLKLPIRRSYDYSTLPLTVGQKLSLDVALYERVSESRFRFVGMDT